MSLQDLLKKVKKVDCGEWSSAKEHKSSRAHFKDYFMLIKNCMGTMPLKFIAILLQWGVITKQKQAISEKQYFLEA